MKELILAKLLALIALFLLICYFKVDDVSRKRMFVSLVITALICICFITYKYYGNR